MQIVGYDYDNSYARTTFRLSVFYLSQLNDLAAGTYEYEGETYIISKTSTSISILSTAYMQDPSLMLSFLTSKGISNANVLNSTTTEATYPSSDGRIRLSTFNAGLSPYYYDLRRNNNYFSVGIGNVSTGSTPANENWRLFHAPVAIYVNDNTNYFGVIGFQSEPNSAYKTVFIISWDPSVTNHSYLQPGASPGTKDFKPVSNIIDLPYVGGGDESGAIPDYDTDVLSQPGAPDESKASVVGSGFLTVYDVTEANLINLGKCLFSSNILTGIANLFINPIDFIISLNIFPYVPNIGASTPIKIGMFNCTQTDAGFDANGFPLTSQFRVIDFGTLNVSEMWQSFLDYDATTFELFLPFIGTVSLSINEVMGGSINLQYTIDFYTGMCVANVLCTRVVASGTEGLSMNQYSQHSYQGNCAIQVPVTQVGYSNLIGSIINAGITGIKDPAAAVLSMGADLATGSTKPNVTSKGSIVANAGFCSTLDPYITIERPITVEPESFQKVIGYPSYIAGSLGECQDLCICDSIDLSGVSGATESELRKISQLCSEGVYV